MEEKKCSTCGTKLGKVETLMALLGFYVLSTSIYGTIELVKKIISLF